MVNAALGLMAGQFVNLHKDSIKTYDCVDDRKTKGTIVTFRYPPNYHCSFNVPDTFDLHGVEVEYFRPAYDEMKRAINADHPDGVHNP